MNFRSGEYTQLYAACKAQQGRIPIRIKTSHLECQLLLFFLVACLEALGVSRIPASKTFSIQIYRNTFRLKVDKLYSKSKVLPRFKSSQGHLNTLLGFYVHYFVFYSVGSNIICPLEAGQVFHQSRRVREAKAMPNTHRRVIVESVYLWQLNTSLWLHAFSHMYVCKWPHRGIYNSLPEFCPLHGSNGCP